MNDRRLKEVNKHDRDTIRYSGEYRGRSLDSGAIPAKRKRRRGGIIIVVARIYEIIGILAKIRNLLSLIDCSGVLGFDLFED